MSLRPNGGGTAAGGAVDVVVIGGGIAGASCLHHLAAAGLRSVLVEREAELGSHSTGRSAAVFAPGYGGPMNDAMCDESWDFLVSDGHGLSDVPLLAPRDLLFVSVVDPEHPNDELPGAEPISIDEAVRRCPVLRPGALSGAALHPGGRDIDVEALLRAFVRGARAAGGDIVRSAEAIAIERGADHWTVDVGGQQLTAALVVNAAGAWGDHVNAAAGLAPVGLRALKRTAFLSPTSAPAASDMSGWPMTIAADHSCYFKPDVPGVLLCSRSEETPVEPGEPTVDELDVAMALERINTLTTLELRSVRAPWAGLRVFTDDRQPVVGSHPDDASFLMALGLGGTGVSTSPAVGARIAQLATERIGVTA